VSTARCCCCWRRRRCDLTRTLIPVWDQQQQQIVLPSFEATIDSWQAMRYERLLQMPDKQLLQYMSTSPEHEPEWFPQGASLGGGACCDVGLLKKSSYHGTPASHEYNLKQEG
jgi:hypothetical protein